MTDVVDLSGNNPDVTIGKTVGDLTASPSRVRLVTPSDTVDLPDGLARALWIGGAGNVAVIAADDDLAVTMSGCAAGSVLPVRVRRVMATNTTATLIVALY